ncbi:hypothetical protein DIPPA_62658 [Diplonema papillatum]|nr:hypothetical protein DIPPA_62658 [Diplonema papillatum]
MTETPPRRSSLRKFIKPRTSNSAAPNGSQSPAPQESDCVTDTSLRPDGRQGLGDGSRWVCCLPSGSSEACELLSKREREGKVEYFVRVLSKDRRLDAWVEESQIVGRSMSSSPVPSDPVVSRKRKRQGRRCPEDPLHVFAMYDGTQADEAAILHADHLREVKWIEKVVFGDYIIDAWYPSPLPRANIKEEVIANGGNLFVDDITLKYTGNAARMQEHKQTFGSGPLGLRGPPGTCLYEDDSWALWEIDGGEGSEYNNEVAGNTVNLDVTQHRIIECATRELYCQNMSLLSKMFLDHKHECFTTSNFVFFVLTEKYHREDQQVTNRAFDSNTLRPAVGGIDYLFRGYFSREKGQRDNNLSCVMVLPPWQRLGLGKMLIHFSYLLSGREARKKKGIGAGSPERPLSDLGKLVYLQYWKSRVVEFLKAWKAAGAHGTIHDIIAKTHIEKRDVLKALRSLDLLINNDDIDWNFTEENLTDSFVPPRYPKIDETKLCHVGLAFGAGDDDESYEV